MPIDRRVTRTRAMLHQALFSLMMEKGYEAISITDICEKANVGRSTFYAHYPSKDELKRSGLDQLRKLLTEQHRLALAKAGEGRRKRLAFSLPMFQHARDHAELYRALVGTRGGSIALDTIRNIISELVRDELAHNAIEAKGAPTSELVVQHLVGAFMAVLRWWLDTGATLPPQEVDAAFRRLAIHGVASHHA